MYFSVKLPEEFIITAAFQVVVQYGTFILSKRWEETLLYKMAQLPVSHRHIVLYIVNKTLPL